MEIVCREAAKLGYHVRAMQHDSLACVNNVRVRIFVVMVSASCGGKRGLDWICNAIDKIFEYRALAPPVRFDDIVAYDSEYELQRRESAQAMLFVCV